MRPSAMALSCRTPASGSFKDSTIWGTARLSPMIPRACTAPRRIRGWLCRVDWMRGPTAGSPISWSARMVSCRTSSPGSSSATISEPMAGAPILPSVSAEPRRMIQYSSLRPWIRGSMKGSPRSPTERTAAQRASRSPSFRARRKLSVRSFCARRCASSRSRSPSRSLFPDFRILPSLLIIPITIPGRILV